MTFNVIGNSHNKKESKSIKEVNIIKGLRGGSGLLSLVLIPWKKNHDNY